MRAALRWKAGLAAILLALGALPPDVAADTGNPAATARLEMRIVIPRVVQARDWEHPDRLDLTEADIERGYVDIDRGTAVTITCNTRTGFLVTANLTHLVTRAVVRIEGQALEFNGEAHGLGVNAARIRDARVQVGYRLYLAPDVVAGTHAWPVALAIGAGA